MLPSPSPALMCDTVRYLEETCRPTPQHVLYWDTFIFEQNALEATETAVNSKKKTLGGNTDDIGHDCKNLAFMHYDA